MKKTIVLTTLLVLLPVAQPAAAHIVEVTTSVSLNDMGGATSLQDALHKAVVSAVRDTIAFTPSRIAVLQTLVIGERLVVRLMIVDEEGERLLDQFAEDSGPGETLPAQSAEVRL